MQSTLERPRLWLKKCVVCGGLAGLVVGLFGGPVVMFADRLHFNYLYGSVYSYHVLGDMFIGRELLAAPIIGVILGVPEGLILGLLWAIKPQRLTLWWLMVVVAGVGLQLGVFVYGSLFGLMVLTFPFMVDLLRGARITRVLRHRGTIGRRWGPISRHAFWSLTNTSMGSG
jgi:hypothetical protein